MGELEQWVLKSLIYFGDNVIVVIIEGKVHNVELGYWNLSMKKLARYILADAIAYMQKIKQFSNNDGKWEQEYWLKKKKNK